MKTIIIPTDFSPAAGNALNYALNMAKDIQADLLLLHVYGIPISVTDVPLPLISVEELQQSAEKQLAELKQQVDHVASGQVNITTEARLGDITDELENVCNKIQPFAVVMGTHDTAGIESLFGSVTISCIRRLSWPVIAVPAGKEYGLGIKKVGLACDFKDVAETTPAGLIKGVTKEFGAQLHVINVSGKGEAVEQESSKEYAVLQSMLEGTTPIYDFIQDEDIEHGIHEFAEKNNLDLVMIVPKKHKLLEGIFKKSATKKLVFHSHVPVMCLH